MARSNPSIVVFCVKSAWRSFVFSYRAWSCLTTSCTSFNAFSSKSLSAEKTMGAIKNPQRTLQRQDQATIPIRLFRFIFFNNPFLPKGAARLSFTARIERARQYCPFQARYLVLSGKGTHVGLRAAVERGPSEGARSGSTGPTWVPFPHTSSAPTGPRRPTTSLRPSRPAAPTRPSVSICSIIRAARG